MNVKEKIKEKVEVPGFTRCCCCLPLRYGLLAWGYFKLWPHIELTSVILPARHFIGIIVSLLYIALFLSIVDICIIPIMVYYLMGVMIMIGMSGETEHLIWIYLYFSLCILSVIYFMTDITMSIVFVVGGHQKKVKLLRPFYIYSIVIFVLSILTATSSICLSLTNSIGIETSVHTWEILMLVFVAYLVIIVVQFYFILLLRSEIVKLRNNAESLKFVNNAAEAECTMVYEEKLYPSLPSPDTETEDVENKLECDGNLRQNT